jgi:RNA polymerase sigma factor (sigma-70 family)
MSLAFPVTRWSLIRRLGDGPEATAVLLELYFDSIARYLKSRFPQETRTGDLDDIIQEVVLHVLEHPLPLSAARPGAGSRFRYLLMTVAMNAARNALRTHRRRVGRMTPTGAIDDEADQALHAALADQGNPLVEAAMDRAWAESVLDQAWNDLRSWAGEGLLEVECIDVLEHSLVQAKTVRQMAPELGISPATCQRRLARGRTFLKRAITDRLTQAGEIPRDADPALACDLLLDLLRRP